MLIVDGNEIVKISPNGRTSFVKNRDFIAIGLGNRARKHVVDHHLCILQAQGLYFFVQLALSDVLDEQLSHGTSVGKLDGVANDFRIPRFSFHVFDFYLKGSRVKFALENANVALINFKLVILDEFIQRLSVQTLLFFVAKNALRRETGV